MHRFRLFGFFVLASLLLIPAATRAGSILPDPLPAKGIFTVAGTVPGVTLEPVATGLDSVTYITHAGDDRLFIVLRAGRIVILSGGAVRSQPFLDVHDLTTVDSERGLLSVAFHPRYAENGFFFVNYTNVRGDTVIARYQVSADPNRADPASARTLLTITQPFANHNGGQLQFGPDGYLYIGMGDGGAACDPSCRAQNGGELSGQDAAHRRRSERLDAPVLRHPAGQPVPRPGRSRRRDLGHGRAQSLALLLRPRHGRPVDRRRGPGRGARRSTSSPLQAAAARTMAGR